jgi:hypothetical protein
VNGTLDCRDTGKSSFPSRAFSTPTPVNVSRGTVQLYNL